MTTTRRSRPLTISDAPEHRSIPIGQIELRDDQSNEATLALSGYASTFEPYEMYGGPSNGFGWIEQIDPSAFTRTLKESPDLHLLINHEGMPLARTKSGTLDLSLDERGLKVDARLDRANPDVQRLESAMRRGDMDEMSFAFRVKSQAWDSTPEFEDDPQALRTITELSLHKGDVSVVNFGANPTTHAEMKSVPEMLRMIAERQSELVEARSDDSLAPVIDELLSALTQDESRDEEVIEDSTDEGDESLDDEAVECLSRLLDDIVEQVDAIGELLDERAVSDTPWSNFSQSDYDDAEWKRACLIDRGDDGDGDTDTAKERYALPVREPSGTLNRNGCHAAASRIHEVNAPTAAVTGAAKKLVSLYKNDLSEDPPASLVSLAERSEPKQGMTLREALGHQGVVIDSDSPLSLAEAMALAS